MNSIRGQYSLQAAVAQAVKLARSSDSEAVRSFCQKVRPQFPQSMELLKLHYAVCGDLAAHCEAILVCLEYLQQSPQAHEVYAMLNASLGKFNKHDPQILDAFAKLATMEACECELYYLVKSRNSLDSEKVFQRLQAQWGTETKIGYAQYADALYDCELYEAAESACWKALERAPMDPLRLRRLIEVILKLSELVYPEKVLEAQQLCAAFLKDRADEPESWLAAALVYRSASRADKAYPYFKRYFDYNPSDRFRSMHVFDASYVEGLCHHELFALRCAWSEMYGRMVHLNEALPKHDFNKERPIRVGYVSADFGEHPVGYFARAVLLRHDRDKFEVFFYSQRDAVSEDDAVSKAFREWVGESNWRWIKEMHPLELVRQIRADQIDILVDLSGHSKGNRLDAFCNRAAPVQVSWLGFPASTGMSQMDYRFSDSIVEPHALADAYSSETIWHLPNGFHALEMGDDLPEPSEPPCLKNGYITFGSFNNINKIGLKTCELWARVLQSIPQARLLLKHKTMEIFANRESIRSFFVMNGVDPQRIRFMGVTPRRADHFENYAHMDVALDPVGYNGTTTTCEALYMGVPVLTLQGDRHASRVSSSLLHRMGMDGWVAKDPEQFVRIAQAASAQPQALKKRRARMREDYKNSALNDGAGLAREMEAAYQAMWHKHCEKFSTKSTN